jgi:hypothetical protein
MEAVFSMRSVPRLYNKDTSQIDGPRRSEGSQSRENVKYDHEFHEIREPRIIMLARTNSNLPVSQSVSRSVSHDPEVEGWNWRLPFGSRVALLDAVTKQSLVETEKT